MIQRGIKERGCLGKRRAPVNLLNSIFMGKERKKNVQSVGHKVLACESHFTCVRLIYTTSTQRLFSAKQLMRKVIFISLRLIGVVCLRVCVCVCVLSKLLNSFKTHSL